MASNSLDSQLRWTQQSHINGLQGPHLQQAMGELLVQLLDDVQRRLTAESHNEPVVNRALDDLFLSLREWKLNCGADDWQQFLTICREHPLMDVVHQDPFTFRAFSKPRGYAGDARMMDYIYGREEDWEPPAADPVGRRIFNYTTLAPASEGVRSRRAWIAQRIDRLAQRRDKPHVLSIAAGHLREVNLSAAVRRRKLGRMAALDADGESLAEVSRCYGRFGVETFPTPFRSLLTNRCDVGKFDLVYTTGLFDYLDQRVGARLVSTMFQMLRPGGRLVVANFLPGVRDIGYMEAYMDWRLIYRSRREMTELTMDIAEEEVRHLRIFSEENQNIIFLELSKN